MEVRRKDMLKKLQNVQFGLSKTAGLVQSDCFVFRKGRVATYNEHVTCSTDFPLSDLEGAVQSDRLLEILKLFDQEKLDVGIEGGVFIIKVPGDKVSLRTEKNITLPLDQLEQPETWRDLPTDFWEAVSTVQGCCTNRKGRFILSCIHLGKEWIEASDKQQICRYRVTTDMGWDLLLKRDALVEASGLSMTQFGETPNWFHFRSNSDLSLSCRKYVETYPPMDKFFSMEGEPLEFPKEIESALGKATVFKDDKNQGYVLIELKPGKVRVVGRDDFGEYAGVRDCVFQGESLKFRIDPRLMREVCARGGKTTVASGKMKIVTDKWEYLTCITKDGGK